LRVVPVHEGLHQDPLLLVGDVEGRLRVVRVPSQRLLAEDVLARPQRVDRPLDVHRVRERDVDRVDVRVREQRFVRPVGALDVPLARVCIRPRLLAAGDRDEVDLLRVVRAGDDLPVDVGGRDDPEVHQRYSA
jgi:hypothetical protein